MAEDFKPSNWWNNPRNSFFDGASQAINSPSAPSLSCSTTISDAFCWSPANEISASKPRLCDNKIEGFSTLSTDWNQTLIRSSGKGESSFKARLEEDLSTRPLSRQEIGESSLTTIPFKDMNFSTSSASSSYVNSSSMFQGLAEQDKGLQQPFLDNQQMADQYRSQMMAFHGFSNETLEPSWNKLPQLFKDFPHKQQYDITDLQFTNNATFWNASAGFYPSVLPYSGIQIFESKPSYSMTAKSSEGIPETKTSNEAELKKPRIEKSSPFPAAFKNILFAGEERKNRGQNHCSPAAGFTIWKDRYCLCTARYH
ncbi:hypothetical protein M5K25_019417 [Dendrobium thyrsiflorum]|uniref:Uncharacterized protein n=1 Tax=Dendrobium thyrsiflorum TaxID=117978 RepID=A0ABD0UFK2_DENTH